MMRISIVATEKGERMMATCKNCLHEKVCVWNAELEEACNEDCSDFKNKADYAEVKHGEWITLVAEIGLHSCSL